ncbi:hypothetical protein SerAS12_2763 [Serratia sp. AS12]|nr:hypothetical protein SerAS9_2762 [Serratia plymuthica AS9]AEF50834.1 hypothetical protein SerAS12_2763 [Serratia sp. AS12]AEG28541.1 hypothetical protein SerAS13_2764 [Serratia sp. AS13]
MPTKLNQKANLSWAQWQYNATRDNKRIKLAYGLLYSGNNFFFREPKDYHQLPLTCANNEKDGHHEHI